ncbi:hypothetical protein H7Y21_00315 [Arenimonas sp.]|nr:hypothetical protein [Candidatus Parcubacteria bacterium]
MSNIKLNLNKKTVSLIILIIVILILIYPVYFIDNKFRNYKTEVLGDYTKLAELQSEKNILSMYNKILLKGSKESIQIKEHILSSDRKDVLGLINELENYVKKVGLTDSGSSPIQSVSTRENTTLTKYKASDLVISIKVAGSEKNIDNFVNLLNNLPKISYIEKFDVRFDQVNNKNSATIILVMFQKNEVK